MSVPLLVYSPMVIVCPWSAVTMISVSDGSVIWYAASMAESMDTVSSSAVMACRAVCAN